MLPTGTLLGELTINEVFIDYDGPQLFSCTSNSGFKYLAVHAPMTEHMDNWLYVRVSMRRLEEIAAGVVTLSDAFARPGDGALWLVSFKDDGSTLAETVNPLEVEEDWFPAAGERLGNLSIAVAESTGDTGDVNLTEFLPSFLVAPAPMWEFSGEVLDYLRSRRTPVAAVAAFTGRSVVDIMLKRGEHRTDLPAATLGKLLLSAQHVIDGLAPDYPAGVKVAAIRDASRLDALAFFPSSFGIRLETHDATLFTHPAVATALERMVALFSAASDVEKLGSLLQECGPKAAIQFRAFARAIEKSNSDVMIEVGVPGRSEPATATVSKVEVGRLVEFLDTEARQVTDHFVFNGSLVGVSLRTKFFRLEDEDKEFSGRIADDYLSSMTGKKVGVRYDARITSVTDINEPTGEERVRFTLTDLKEV